jgi:hypothetical protein
MLLTGQLNILNQVKAHEADLGSRASAAVTANNLGCGVAPGRHDQPPYAATAFSRFSAIVQFAGIIFLARAL